MARFSATNCYYSGEAYEGGGALVIEGDGKFELVDPLLSIAKLVFYCKWKSTSSSQPGMGYLTHPQYGSIWLFGTYDLVWSDWHLLEVYFIYDPDTDTRVGVAYDVNPETGEKTVLESTAVQTGAPAPDTIGFTTNAYGNLVIDSLKIYGVAGEIVSERSLPQIVSSMYETLLE